MLLTCRNPSPGSVDIVTGKSVAVVEGSVAGGSCAEGLLLCKDRLDQVIHVFAFFLCVSH